MSAHRPKYIVVHTAAYNARNCDRDTIDRWHRERGWRGIGYHYVIINDKHDHLKDGEVQKGRDINFAGAHVRGMNQRSIGICCVGHGDHEPFTDRQYESLTGLLSNLIDQYEDICVSGVIGHREVNRLVAEGILGSEYATSKTCPGKLVDMDLVRSKIISHREQIVELPSTLPTDELVAESQIQEALHILERVPSDVFPNANQELREFLFHPEVLAFRCRL